MLDRLHAAVQAVCPIFGVSGVQGDIRIDFDPSATGPQQTAATNAVAAFDWSQGAHDAWLLSKQMAAIGRANAVRKAANQSSTVVTLADVTDLRFPLEANTHYAYQFVGAYTAAATTTGLRLAVNGPASPVLVRAVGCIAETATTARNGAVGAYETQLSGAANTASSGATAMPFWVDGNISTNSAGGFFTLRFGSEVAGSQVTILSGSYGLLYAIG